MIWGKLPCLLHQNWNCKTGILNTEDSKGMYLPMPTSNQMSKDFPSKATDVQRTFSVLLGRSPSVDQSFGLGGLPLPLSAPHLSN